MIVTVVMRVNILIIDYFHNLHYLFLNLNSIIVLKHIYLPLYPRFYLMQEDSLSLDVQFCINLYSNHIKIET